MAPQEREPVRADRAPVVLALAGSQGLVDRVLAASVVVQVAEELVGHAPAASVADLAVPRRAVVAPQVVVDRVRLSAGLVVGVATPRSSSRRR